MEANICEVTKAADEHDLGVVGPLDSWMSRLPTEARGGPLCRLAIPGSHNSFSYSLHAADCPPAPAPDLTGPLAALCSCAPRLARPLVTRWAVTQQLDVYQQLAAGVRYLDVRAALHARQLHVVHGVHGPPLAPLLADVRRFVERQRGELVVLDLQHVYGLDAAAFADLAALLRDTFGGALVPRGPAPPPLAACAAAGRSVLAVYRGGGAFAEDALVWDETALWSPWPDTQKASRLFPMLDRHIERAVRLPAGRLHVHQCVFTPQRRHLLMRAASSLRRLATDCNCRADAWLHEQSVRRGLNIVMFDFVGVGECDLTEKIVRKNYEL